MPRSIFNVKLLAFLITLQSLSNTAYSQCRDTIRYTASGLYDVHTFSDDEIIACGANGQILKSNDGGTNWRSINSTNRYAYNISSMSFPSDSIGFAVGSYLFKTEDKGETWIPLYAPLGYNYTDVCFINKNIGFVTSSDGYILKTLDGGINWTQSYNTYDRLSSVYFKNDSTGYATGPSGSLLNTTDTGRTWKEISFSAPFGSRLNKITFVSDLVGYAVGQSFMLKTVDGGLSWIQQPSPLSVYLSDVLFLNQDIGFAIGDFNSGAIFKTSDGGASWNQLDYGGLTGSLVAMSVNHTTNKLIIVGSQGLGTIGNGRFILTSIDEGLTWKRESDNYNYNFYASQFLNNQAIFIAGESGKIYKSKDKGESWRELNFYSQNPITDALFFINESKGFIFNNKDLINGDEMYETSNGGNTWIQNAFPDTPVNSNDRGRKIFFWDTQIGLAIKGLGIYKTIDGGKTWALKRDNVINGSIYDSFKDGSFQNNGSGYAISFGGSLFQTKDYGETWNQIQLNNSSEYFQSVYTVNDSIAFIGGNSGLVYKTTDGGKNWIHSSAGINGWNVVSFHFIDPSKGYASCNNYGGTGVIYQTIDTGKTWTSVLQPDEPHTISGNKKDFIITGNFGTILKNDIEPAPVTGYISGPTKACLNDTKIYSTARINANTYQWQLSEGGTSSIANNFDSILWTTAGLHTLNLTAINNCGIGEKRQIIVDVAAFNPMITQADSVLTASEGTSYQWYRNNILIPASAGGRSRSIVARQSGTFTVTVTSVYGCSRTTSPYAYNTPNLCPYGSTTFTSNVTGTTYQWQVNTGNGFANISNGGYFSGANNMSLILSFIPPTWYGYKFRCLVDNNTYSDISELRFSNTWTGTYNTSWEYGYNWLCGYAPTSNTDVIILSGSVIINSNVSCRSLTVYPGAQVIVNTGYTLTISH